MKCLCFVLTKSYIIGAKVMLYSFFNTTKQFNHDIVCFHDSSINENHKNEIKEINENIIFKEINETKYLNLETETKRLKNSFYKFEIFSLDNYDRIVFLDSDLVVIKNINYLFETESDISAIQDYSTEWIDQNKNIFNTGVMSIRKKYISKNITNKLIEIAKKEKSLYGDQDIINILIKDYERLSSDYNTLKITFQCNGTWAINPKIIHYIGTKPWEKINDSIDKNKYTIAERYWLWHYLKINNLTFESLEEFTT
jgi:lipopolysaccharide biosynthesis glycosyltransferase